MLRRLASTAFLLPLSLWLGGCATYTDQMKDMNSAYRAGNYSGALEIFDKTDLKDQDRNRVLYQLEKGSILDRLAERKESRTHWLKADKDADDLYTTSLSKEAATYLFNEGAQAYAGEDYEKVAIHTMLAHSFLSDGNLDEARVEAARINTKLSEVNGFYKDNKNKYKDDAYARFLSGLIYESSGEYDAAIVDYRASLKVYESEYSPVFGVSAPRDLVRSLYRLMMLRDRKDEARLLSDSYKTLNLASVPLDSASIVVVHEVGIINEKKATDFVLPLGGQIVRFSFPVIRKQSNPVSLTGVRLDEGPFEPGELAQNFNTIAYENLEDRRFRTIAKSAARLILKGQMTQKAQKELGPIGWLAGNIYGAVTETADTRQWTTLPAAIYVTRVFVKAGSYDLSISNNGRAGEVRKIQLKHNELKILRDASSRPRVSTHAEGEPAAVEPTATL